MSNMEGVRRWVNTLSLMILAIGVFLWAGAQIYLMLLDPNYYVFTTIGFLLGVISTLWMLNGRVFLTHRGLAKVWAAMEEYWSDESLHANQIHHSVESHDVENNYEEEVEVPPFPLDENLEEKEVSFSSSHPVAIFPVTPMTPKIFRYVVVRGYSENSYFRSYYKEPTRNRYALVFSSNPEEAQVYEDYWEAVQVAAFCSQELLREEIIKVLELGHDAIAPQLQRIR